MPRVGVRNRAVLVGCGAMSRGWLRALGEADLAEKVEVVAFVDTDPVAAAQLRDESGLESAVTGTDLSAVLAQVNPNLLFDVVAPAARHDVVATGLRLGCHVLSEKPMAASLIEAHDLVALAADAGKVHAVVQNRRYTYGVRRIRHLIESGALGELTALHADFFIGAHFVGFRNEMQNALLLDMAIHTFDAARFMSGKDAQAVYCHEANPRGSWYAHGAAANAVFELEGDVTFTYRGSWAAEGADTSWEGRWRIIGTKGTLVWDGADHFEAHVVAGDAGFHRPLAALELPSLNDAMRTHGHASIISEFIDAVETGRSPETVGSDNINSLAMVFAAIASARTHTRQSLSPRNIT